MAPVTQYVFAEMRRISEHFTAGSHEWLPYSVIPTFPKLICKHQFAVLFHDAVSGEVYRNSGEKATGNLENGIQS